MKSAKQNIKAFTLLEIMVVIAVIGIIVAIAVPMMLGAKRLANERTAISNIRGLFSAQIQYKETGRKDLDSDEEGEFGTLANLVENRLMVLSMADGNICGSRSGYYFKILLPSVDNGGNIDSDEESFCAVAWPALRGKTGTMSYAVDFQGNIYTHANTDGNFDGLTSQISLSDVYNAGGEFQTDAIKDGWALLGGGNSN